MSDTPLSHYRWDDVKEEAAVKRECEGQLELALGYYDHSDPEPDPD